VAVAVLDTVTRAVPVAAAERVAGRADTVSVLMAGAVFEPPMERVAEGELEGLRDSRGEPLSDGAALEEREPRVEMDEVAVEDTEGVSEKERVWEGVADAHAEAVEVADADRVAAAVRDAEGHSVWVRDPGPLRLGDVEAEPRIETVKVNEASAVGLTLGTMLAEGAAVEVGTTRSTSPKPRYSRPSFGARTRSAYGAAEKLPPVSRKRSAPSALGVSTNRRRPARSSNTSMAAGTSVLYWQGLSKGWRGPAPLRPHAATPTPGSAAYTVIAASFSEKPATVGPSNVAISVHAVPAPACAASGSAGVGVQSELRLLPPSSTDALLTPTKRRPLRTWHAPGSAPPPHAPKPLLPTSGTSSPEVP
jgi:hypothetical protein